MFLNNFFEARANNMCEGIYHGSPEYFSCITSLFMFSFGVLGLFFSKSPLHLIKTLHTLLILNGIGSFGHHWMMTIGWKIVDNITIFLALWISGYIFINEIINKIYKKYKYGILATSIKINTITGMMNILFSSIALMGCLMIIDSDTNDLLSIHRLLPVLFGIPLFIISTCYFVMRYSTHQPSCSEFDSIHMFNNAQIFHAFSVLFIGTSLCVVFTSADQIVEIYCPELNNQWLRFLGIHGLWHFAISIGLYMISQFLVFISTVDDDQISGNFMIYSSRYDKCNQFLNTMVPIVTCDDNLY